MLHKLLLTAGFVLFLSTLASSNECARYRRHCEAQTPKPAKTTQQAPQTPPAKPVQPVAKPATPRTVTSDTESSTLVINKLLYI